jgi:hypothetical protein
MTSAIIKRPIISSYPLESICQMIAATENGLKGSEIRNILADSGLSDTDPAMTKWKIVQRLCPFTE